MYILYIIQKCTIAKLNIGDPCLTLLLALLQHVTCLYFLYKHIFFVCFVGTTATIYTTNNIHLGTNLKMHAQSCVLLC